MNSSDKARPVVARALRDRYANAPPSLVALCATVLAFAWPTKLCSYIIAPRGRIGLSATMHVPARRAAFESLAIAPSGNVIAVLLVESVESLDAGTERTDSSPPSVILLHAASLALLARVELALPTHRFSRTPMVFTNDHTLFLATAVYSFVANYDHVAKYATLPRPTSPRMHQTSPLQGVRKSVTARYSYTTRMLARGSTLDQNIAGIVVHLEDGCAIYSASFPHNAPHLLLQYFDPDFRVLAVIGLHTAGNTVECTQSLIAIALVQEVVGRPLPKAEGAPTIVAPGRPLLASRAASTRSNGEGDPPYPRLYWAFLGNRICTPYSLVRGLDGTVDHRDFPLSCAVTEQQIVVVSTQRGGVIALDPMEDPSVASTFTPGVPHSSSPCDDKASPSMSERLDACSCGAVALAASCTTTGSGPAVAVVLPNDATPCWLDDDSAACRMDCVRLLSSKELSQRVTDYDVDDSVSKGTPLYERADDCTDSQSSIPSQTPADRSTVSPWYPVEKSSGFTRRTPCTLDGRFMR
jgi:hypothetical protein